jgi:hypothetical protein
MTTETAPCGCVTETDDDGVALVVSQCQADFERCRAIDSKLTQGLDWELDQLVGAAAKGRRCERIWKDGPP